MSQVEFEETRIKSIQRFDNPPKMVNWVIKYSGGLIKNERQANYFLFGLAISLILISFFLFFSLGGTYNYESSTDTDFVSAEI